jgi:hypothetical protein
MNLSSDFFHLFRVLIAAVQIVPLHPYVDLRGHQVIYARLPIPLAPTSHSPFRPIDLRSRPLTADAVMALRLPKLNLIPVASVRVHTDHIAHAYTNIN